MAQDIQKSLERDRIAEDAVGWGMIFRPTPAVKRMLIVGVGVAMAQQAVGIDAIQYYLLDVLKDVLQQDNDGPEDQPSKEVLVILSLLGILKLFFVVVGSKLLDSTGRKKLLTISLLGKSRMNQCCSFFLRRNCLESHKIILSHDRYGWSLPFD